MIPSQRVLGIPVIPPWVGRGGPFGGGSSGGVPPDPPPEPPPPEPPPDPGDIVGYGASVTGGGDTITATVNSAASDAWPTLRAALLGSGTRYIAIIGNGVITADPNQTTKIEHGDITVDGSNWSRSLKYAGRLYFKDCSNVILRYLALAPGDRDGNVEDWAAIKLNGVAGFALDHMVLRWGPDVVGSVLNNCADGTIQYSELGPCLMHSHIGESPKGYGFNVTTPGNQNPAVTYVKRLSVVRNAILFNRQRNLKYEHADGVEAVNNVIGNYGNQPGKGNPRGYSAGGNMFRKGPESQGSNRIHEPDTNYAEYDDSTYYPLTGTDRNILFDVDGTPLTPTVDIATAARLTTPYGGGFHNVTVAEPSQALLEEVLAEAGRGFDDAVSAAVKAHILAGTSDGYYDGPGTGPGPNPSW